MEQVGGERAKELEIMLVFVVARLYFSSSSRLARFTHSPLLPRSLPRHDKCTPNVAVFYVPFPVGPLQVVRCLERASSRCVWDGNHDVNVVVRVALLDLFGELLAHLEPRLVHRYAVHDAVWACEVHVLEHAGGEFGGDCD